MPPRTPTSWSRYVPSGSEAPPRRPSQSYVRSPAARPGSESAPTRPRSAARRAARPVAVGREAGRLAGRGRVGRISGRRRRVLGAQVEARHADIDELRLEERIQLRPGAVVADRPDTGAAQVADVHQVVLRTEALDIVVVELAPGRGAGRAVLPFVGGPGDLLSGIPATALRWDATEQ